MKTHLIFAMLGYLLSALIVSAQYDYDLQDALDYQFQFHTEPVGDTGSERYWHYLEDKDHNLRIACNRPPAYLTSPTANTDEGEKQDAYLRHSRFIPSLRMTINIYPKGRLYTSLDFESVDRYAAKLKLLTEEAGLYELHILNRDDAYRFDYGSVKVSPPGKEPYYIQKKPLPLPLQRNYLCLEYELRPTEQLLEQADSPHDKEHIFARVYLLDYNNLSYKLLVQASEKSYKSVFDEVDSWFRSLAIVK